MASDAAPRSATSTRAGPGNCATSGDSQQSAEDCACREAPHRGHDRSTACPMTLGGWSPCVTCSRPRCSAHDRAGQGGDHRVRRAPGDGSAIAAVWCGRLPLVPLAADERGIHGRRRHDVETRRPRPSGRTADETGQRLAADRSSRPQPSSLKRLQACASEATGGKTSIDLRNARIAAGLPVICTSSGCGSRGGGAVRKRASADRVAVIVTSGVFYPYGSIRRSQRVPSLERM
jgi:hypothetical protein